MTHLILVPGLVCDASLWQAQVRELRADCETIVSDVQFGAGSIDDMAESLLHQAPQRFALAGLSMGGYIAMAVLRQAPDRVERLALLNTSARADLAEQSEFRRGLIEQAEIGDFESVLDTLLPLFLGETAATGTDLTAQVRRMARGVGARAFIRQQRAIIERPDARPCLPAIDCPTLVICGNNDRLTPPTLAQEISAGIRGAHCRLLSDCGHLSPLEQPAAVTAALREWLRA